MVEISEVDVHDDGELRAFWEVEQAAHRAGRDRPSLRSYEILTMLRDPNPYFRHELMVAREGDRVVGTADLGCSVGDTLHLADLEVTVHPDRQRRGIGSALFQAARRRLSADGRTTVVGEAYVPGGVANEQAAAYAFAAAQGLRSVHVEDHLVLELPAVRKGESIASGWEIVTWRAHCPEELREAYCRMRTQMENDVPRGEIDYEPFVFDSERLRVGEERIARGYHQVVAAARRSSDGTFGGYSLVFVPYGATEAIQDDTLVMPEHRGHRLGLAIKTATLDVLSREHPELTAIHTWTSADNAAMQRTNRVFGYVPVDRMHEMQGSLGASDA
jgi:GNAT superfamily N-acetyltransferase